MPKAGARGANGAEVTGALAAGVLLTGDAAGVCVVGDCGRGANGAPGVAAGFGANGDLAPEAGPANGAPTLLGALPGGRMNGGAAGRASGATLGVVAGGATGDASGVGRGTAGDGCAGAPKVGMAGDGNAGGAEVVGPSAICVMGGGVGARGAGAAGAAWSAGAASRCSAADAAANAGATSRGGAADAAANAGADVDDAVATPANSARASMPPAIVITPPHTEHRARTRADGTFDGSTRKIDRHSGQETFMTSPPPGRRASIRRCASRRRAGCPSGDRPRTRSLGASWRSSSFPSRAH